MRTYSNAVENCVLSSKKHILDKKISIITLKPYIDKVILPNGSFELTELEAFHFENILKQTSPIGEIGLQRDKYRNNDEFKYYSVKWWPLFIKFLESNFNINPREIAKQKKQVLREKLPSTRENIEKINRSFRFFSYKRDRPEVEEEQDADKEKVVASKKKLKKDILEEDTLTEATTLNQTSLTDNLGALNNYSFLLSHLSLFNQINSRKNKNFNPFAFEALNPFLMIKNPIPLQIQNVDAEKIDTEHIAYKL